MARPFDKIKPLVDRVSEGSPEVLFLHGAWHGGWCWVGLARRVAEAGYGVSLLELPGHGPSGSGNRWSLPGTTSLKDYALLAARAAADLGRPVLVGHSMGGFLVQKIWEVADLPGVLIAPLPGTGLPPTRLVKLFLNYPAQMAGTFVGRPLAWKRPSMAARLFFRERKPDSLAEYTADLVPEPARVALEMGLGLVRARPGRGKSPRLIIAAEHDYFMPVPSLKRLADHLGAAFTLLPGAPHNPWLEDPEGKVAALLLEFLKKAAPTFRR